uniref:Uncharacterized protein n=1 Tax=Zea mays TaxID=4577 RepID=A0A804Q8P0_MAIZE
MEVKSAMLASSLNLTPTLSASATALFPASSARIAAPALSMEGTSATARSPWKARPPPRIVAPSLSTPVTAHSLWKHLKTPLGELVKGNKNKSTIELWVEKFYKKVTNLPEPFPHDLVEKLEEYLDKLEGQLVDLSSLLYDHRLVDAYQNSTDILQSTIFTQQYVERVLANERDKMKCCSIEYSHPKQSSQAFVYGGILLAGFLVYSLVIFFSSPVR